MNAVKLTMTTGRRVLLQIGPVQADEADQRDGQPGQEQDVEEVVDDAVDPHADQPDRADREVAAEGRRVVPGEDVRTVDGESVGDGLARERAAEDQPVPDRPGQEDQSGDGGDRQHEPDPCPSLHAVVQTTIAQANPT